MAADHFQAPGQKKPESFTCERISNSVDYANFHWTSVPPLEADRAEADWRRRGSRGCANGRLGRQPGRKRPLLRLGGDSFLADATAVPVSRRPQGFLLFTSAARQ